MSVVKLRLVWDASHPERYQEEPLPEKRDSGVATEPTGDLSHRRHEYREHDDDDLSCSCRLSPPCSTCVDFTCECGTRTRNKVNEEAVCVACEEKREGCGDERDEQ